MTSILLGSLATEASSAVLGANIFYPVTIARIGQSPQTGSGYAGSAREMKKALVDPGLPTQAGRKVIVLASSLASPPKFGDVVTPTGRGPLVVANRPGMDPAGVAWTLFCLDRPPTSVRLFPPIGTGGDYDEDAMDTAEAEYAPVGPIAAILRDLTDDEIQVGLGANGWLAGDSIKTGVAVVEVPDGVELSAAWRIEVGASIRTIRAVSQDPPIAKVFYA